MGRTLFTACAAALLLAACAAEDAQEDSPAKAKASDAPAPPAMKSAVSVVITPPAMVEGTPRPEIELVGLMTALLEHALTDLDGVVPKVGGTPVSPGLQAWLSADVATWKAKLELKRRQGSLIAVLELCDPKDHCGPVTVEDTEASPSRVVAALATLISEKIGRTAGEHAQEAWPEPQSTDPYALLLCGRAAAVWYGLMSSANPEWIGDKRRDPITRAVYIDPRMAIAQWIDGRRHWSLQAATAAEGAFERARKSRPDSTVFKADHATALVLAGEPKEALALWDVIAQEAPADPRFAVARARAVFGAGQITKARAILDALGSAFQKDRSVVELRVAIAEATGTVEDELLARWQEAALVDPEPVRRRIANAVRNREFRKALALATDLAGRGQKDEAARLSLALAASLGDWDRVEHEAAELGLPDLVERVRARRVADRDLTVAAMHLVKHTDPIAAVTRGEALLQQQRWALALDEAQHALQLAAWMPEALSLKRRALLGLGRTDEATSVLADLRSADPAWVETSTAPAPADAGFAPAADAAPVAAPPAPAAQAAAAPIVGEGSRPDAAAPGSAPDASPEDAAVDLDAEQADTSTAPWMPHPIRIPGAPL